MGPLAIMLAALRNRDEPGGGIYEDRQPVVDWRDPLIDERNPWAARRAEPIRRFRDPEQEGPAPPTGEGPLARLLGGP